MKQIVATKSTMYQLLAETMGQEVRSTLPARKATDFRKYFRESRYELSWTGPEGRYHATLGPCMGNAMLTVRYPSTFSIIDISMAELDRRSMTKVV